MGDENRKIFVVLEDGSELIVSCGVSGANSPPGDASLACVVRHVSSGNDVAASAGEGSGKSGIDLGGGSERCRGLESHVGGDVVNSELGGVDVRESAGNANGEAWGDLLDCSRDSEVARSLGERCQELVAGSVVGAFELGVKNSIAVYTLHGKVLRNWEEDKRRGERVH